MKMLFITRALITTAMSIINVTWQLVTAYVDADADVNTGKATTAKRGEEIPHYRNPPGRGGDGERPMVEYAGRAGI